MSSRGSRSKRRSDRATPDTLPAARPARWWRILLLAGGLAVYSNSFTAPFVFDDQGSIVENSHIRHLWPLRDVLLGPSQSSIAGRPVVGLSLALNYAWGGLTSWTYRAGNLSIHLLAGLLLFGIVRRGLTSEHVSPPLRVSADGLAFAAALIWLIHPLQTEVIDYITQRTESMMGLWYLLTFYAAMRAMSDTGAVTKLRLERNLTPQPCEARRDSRGSEGGGRDSW